LCHTSVWSQNDTSNSSAHASDWLIQPHADEESAGHGLPVLALNHPDWPNYRSGTPATARATQRIQVELMATHSQGWRFGALSRAEGQIRASADAVTAAALNAAHADPQSPKNFLLDAHSQIWRGDGLKLGTPWLALPQALGNLAHWQWQADAQLLRLRQLRISDLQGGVNYAPATGYGFDVQTLRASPQITGPFLPPSGTSGLGTSLSLAIQGTLAPGWAVALRADDLWSRLSWHDLATEQGVLNSQITTRAPDGSLDYKAPYTGQQALRHTTRRIGTHWQAQVRWADAVDAPQAAAWTARAERQAGINQLWLGWDNGDTSRLHWGVALEPSWPAVQVSLGWSGWHAALGTDGKGMKSEYRHLHLGWQTRF
jgi:hypothetical protein